MEKMYGIEKIEGYRGVCEYRFYSLYNGARGTWRETKKEAVQDGEAHQRIVLSLHRMVKITDELGESEIQKLKEAKIGRRIIINSNAPAGTEASS